MDVTPSNMRWTKESDQWDLEGCSKMARSAICCHKQSAAAHQGFAQTKGEFCSARLNTFGFSVMLAILAARSRSRGPQRINTS